MEEEIKHWPPCVSGASLCPGSRDTSPVVPFPLAPDSTYPLPSSLGNSPPWS